MIFTPTSRQISCLTVTAPSTFLPMQRILTMRTPPPCAAFIRRPCPGRLRFVLPEPMEQNRRHWARCGFALPKVALQRMRRMPAAPSPKTRKSGRRHFFAPSCARFPGARFLLPYSMTLATTPDATVRPPSRMANRSPCSIAIGVISVISIRMLSPGITISTPSGSLIVPVTSVVRK